MLIVLSRKGFDSTAGGCASPILPDGTLLSLPIPDKWSPIRYQDIEGGRPPLGRLVSELTRGKQKPSFGAHLDPDLRPTSYPRKAGWRGLFGQADSAQGTLERNGVGPGDVFVFFGWFRRVEEHVGALRFVKGAPDLHAIWGWLQVDEVLRLPSSRIPPWAEYHPHVTDHRCKKNTLYVARERLSIEGSDIALPGSGVFEKYDDRLRLTKPGAPRSVWNLPGWFAPGTGHSPLGYHGDAKRWLIDGHRVDLRSAARGQEFVLDCEHYPEALGWLQELVSMQVSPS